MKMILDDVAALRRRVDIVVVAFHWGVIWVPRVIADYQVIAAHACIDAGADLILGHHAHVPKAIEMYKGKAIFYSLSNFCMTKPFPSPKWSERAVDARGAAQLRRPESRVCRCCRTATTRRRTLLAKAVFAKDGVKSVSFLPMMIDELYRPEVLRAGDPRFDDMVRYMDWASEGFDHSSRVRGDEVIVTQ